MAQKNQEEGKDRKVKDTIERLERQKDDHADNGGEEG